MTIAVILVLVFYIYLGYKKPGIALITVPFVSITLGIITSIDENPLAGIIAGFLFLATLVSVLISKRRYDSPQWPHICAKLILIIIFLLSLFAVMSVVLGPIAVLGIFFIFILIGSIIAYGLISQHATAAYVVSTIGSSIRQNLPLAMALETASIGIDNKRSRILRKIQKWLVQGYSLSESIKRGYPMCPGYAVSMIAAAERIDQLPKAMASLEADMMTRSNESRKIRPVYPFYPILLFIFIFFILLGLMTFVIPSFSSVLSEMIEGNALPKPTQILLGVMRTVVYDYVWVLGVIVILVNLIFLPYRIYCKFRPRKPDAPYLLSRLGDYIKWRLPVLHYFERNYSLVQVVELLRLSLNAGCTVNDAIANTLKLDVNNSFKRRLRKWLRKVEEGENISTAARKCRIGAPVAWAFDDKINQGNTPAILETLESFYRSSYSYSVNLARCIMWPLVILAMGFIVGFVVISIFLPGIQIINTLSGSTMP